MKRPRTSKVQGARVLILEDEYFIADDLARALREAGGEPVGPVSTVKQAEELVALGGLDAAILDLNLRGEMASDFIRRLATAELPCLIVSGYGEMRETGPFAMSAVVWPRRLTAFTSAPFETRYLITSLSPRAAA